MRSIPNQFSKKDVEPRLSVWDDDDNKIVFGNPNIDAQADYGRIYDFTVSQNIDSSGPSLDVSFRNHPDLESLDPLDSNSDFNDGTIATNLMNHQHKVELEISKDSGSSWELVFSGFIGNVSARKRVDKNDIIQFSPYGKFKPLKDVIILEGAPNQPLEYYDVDAFDCVDFILEHIDRYEGYDYDFSNLNFNRAISDNPNKTITEYKVKNTNVWDALKEIFAQTGYKLFFWYDDSDSYDLAVIDPNRGEISSIDHSFTGDFDTRRIDLNDRDVRSQVVVFYNDKDQNNVRRRVSVENDTTRQNYGASNYGGNRIHRTMVLKEDKNSLIDTETEAEAYANNALNDLRTPTPDVELSFPYAVPGIQIYDKIEAGGTDDYTVQLGVTSVEYSFNVDRKIGSTTIRGSVDRIIGEQSYWLNKGQLPDDIDAQKGDRKPPPKPENPPRIETTDYVDQSGTTRMKAVCYGEKSPAWDTAGYQFRYRVIDTRTDNIIDWFMNLFDEQWKYPDQVKNPQKTISGLPVGEDLQLEVEYSVIDWENTEWSGLPGDSSYSDTGTASLYIDIVPPAAPTDLKTTPGPEQIKLEWEGPTVNINGEECTDLNYHYVYIRSGSAPDKDTYDSRQKIDGESWTYNSQSVNTSYYFGVTAIDNSGNESQMSLTQSPTSPNVAVGDGKAPGTPTGLTITRNAVDHQEDGTVYAIIKLAWDDNTESDLKGYEVGLSDDGGSTWSRIDASESSETTIKPLKPNTSYSFRIRAVDTEQKSSNWTSSLSITTERDRTEPSIPDWATTAVETKPGQIIFHWQPVSAKDLSHYEVAVDQGNDGSFENTYRTKSTDFTVYGAYGTTYGAKVRAVDTSGNASEYTSTVETGTANKTDSGDIAANAITANEIAANTITADEINAESQIVVGDGTNNNGYIKSQDFDGTPTDPYNDPGSTGWAISAIGDAAFNNVVVRGDFDATDYKLVMQVVTADPVSLQEGQIWLVT